MTITQAITAAQALTGQVYDQATLLRWLSELDGQLAFEVWGATSWTAYTEDDLASLLLVPYPWDGGIYVHYLEAMTYFSNGEYDRYANARAQYDNALGEFRRFVQRTKTTCGKITVQQAGDGGSAVTIIGRGGKKWDTFSAYSVAVLHGYTGTQDEWLASLKGEPGQDGVDGTVSFDELTPEQRASLKGDPGDPGAPGVSPVLSIGTVATLPAGSKATASMGGTQATPTLNLGIPAANVWSGTKPEYDALESHDAGCLYLIYHVPAAISVSSPPTKISYTVGETLELAGIAVALVYDDGDSEIVPNSACTFSPADGTTLDTAGTVTITASYTIGGVTYTATTAVTVAAAT